SHRRLDAENRFVILVTSLFHSDFLRRSIMRRGVKWADAAAVIVLMLLLGGYTVAQVQRAQEMANRVRCASNLRQIGQAMLLYSNENRGAYPRTLMDLDKPTPTWGTPYEGNEKLGALPP